MEEEGETGETPTSKHNGWLAAAEEEEEEEEEEEAEEALIDQIKQSTNNEIERTTQFDTNFPCSV